MKLGNIEVNGIREVVFKVGEKSSIWFRNGRNSWSKCGCMPWKREDDMIRTIKSFVGKEGYRIWVSGETINIVKKD